MGPYQFPEFRMKLLTACQPYLWNIHATTAETTYIMPAHRKQKVKGEGHPCTGRTAHRGSSGIALPFLDHGTRRGWGVSVTPRPLFTPEKDPVPIVQRAGWAPGPVWTGAENFAPTGIRSPDRPAHSQSLYRLRYPAYTQNIGLD